VLAASRTTVIAASAEIDQARIGAAADAGLALAMAGLVNPGPAGPPPPDGRIRRVRFGDATITFAVEDEQGKIPLNAIDEEQARRMFALLGVATDRLDLVVDSFLDWTDDDDDPRPDGAEADYYAPRHVRPRNGMLLSIAEAGMIRGFDARLVEAIGKVATVHFGQGSFRPEHASLLAIQVLHGETGGAIDLINRRRELAGQSTALRTDGADALVNRPLTVVVTVQLDSGARRTRRSLVMLTGRPSQPYVVRERD
jgi:general secretion pathway protein K